MRYGTAANETIEERGVYWARHRKKGCPVAYAVDSHGERVKQFYVLPTSNPDDAVAALWRYLDLVDPVPRLELVRATPAPALPRPTKPVLDPYADDQQYRRRLVSKMRFFRD
jgi:hypothetical protein